MKLVLMVIISLVTFSIADFTVPVLKYSASDVECAIQNAYYEARGEPIEGIKAVTKVVVNRAKNSKRNESLCDIIFKKGQFSWTADKRKRGVPKKAQQPIRLAVWDALAERDGGSHDASNGATYYHSVEIPKPKWTETLKVSAIIGNHIFYKDFKWNTQRVNTLEPS